MISITALEKSINILKIKLESKGLSVDTDVFKSGRGSDYYMGSSSYVEISVDRGDEYIGTYKFLAYDYVSNSKRTYGGSSIADMKREFFVDFNKDCN